MNTPLSGFGRQRARERVGRSPVIAGVQDHGRIELAGPRYKVVHSAVITSGREKARQSLLQHRRQEAARCGPSSGFISALALYDGVLSRGADIGERPRVPRCRNGVKVWGMRRNHRQVPPICSNLLGYPACLHLYP